MATNIEVFVKSAKEASELKGLFNEQIQGAIISCQDISEIPEEFKGTLNEEFEKGIVLTMNEAKFMVPSGVLPGVITPLLFSGWLVRPDMKDSTAQKPARLFVEKAQCG